jgi:hypothetical protein
VTGLPDATLLGAPLVEAGLTAAADRRLARINHLCRRSELLHPQQAVFLLRNSILAPRLTYSLRTAPFYLRPDLLESFDALFREACATSMNVNLTDRLWEKAVLPLRSGGLGFRCTVDLAGPCYASSLAQCSALLRGLLTDGAFGTAMAAATAARTFVQARLPGVHIADDSWPHQGALDALLVAQKMEALEASADSDIERARLLASRQARASAWLEALPGAAVGTLLFPNHFRVCVALRLGAPLYRPHTCARCGQLSDAAGVHALACPRSAGRIPRHAMLNRVLADGLRRAGFCPRLEPQGLSPASGLRPDGLTLVPYARGRCLVWDATVWSTLCATQLSSTARRAGAAAEAASILKRRKYAELEKEYIVEPLAFETHGSESATTAEFLKGLGGHITAATGDTRDRRYFYEQVSLAIQRGNALSLLGTTEPD